MLDEQIQRELQEFVKTPEYQGNIMSLSARGMKEYIATDEYAERLGGIVQESVKGTLSAYLLESYNGSDNLVLKPFPEAFADMSWNVRQAMIEVGKAIDKIDENAAIIKKHGEYLKGKEQWTKFKIALFNVGRVGDETFHLRKRWKILIPIIVATTGILASPVAHKILNIVLGLFGWKAEIK